MPLTTLLLLLKVMTVFIEPGRPDKGDDRTLVRCATDAMTARPSALQIVKDRSAAQVIFTVTNESGVRIHVVGRLSLPDGTTLLEVNHVTHGFNHSLCNQMKGLLDEMGRKGRESAALMQQAIDRVK